jgi:hypothetical protein
MRGSSLLLIKDLRTRLLTLFTGAWLPWLPLIALGAVPWVMGSFLGW